MSLFAPMNGDIFPIGVRQWLRLVTGEFQSLGNRITFVMRSALRPARRCLTEVMITQLEAGETAAPVPLSASRSLRRREDKLPRVACTPALDQN
jgi:hypothetical protein